MVLVALALVVGGALLARLAPVVLPERCAITGGGAASVRLTPEQAANAATIAALRDFLATPAKAAGR